MKYAMEQRLRMIDFLVDTYGYINRSVIMDYFDVGSATVTRDSTEYQNIRPDNLIYSVKEKRYYKSNNFERLFD